MREDISKGSWDNPAKEQLLKTRAKKRPRSSVQLLFMRLGIIGLATLEYKHQELKP